ncbi:MAG: hypothetical protein O2897_00760 [bacterium]|nr:hypothetical protein [bacterium]
MLENNTKVDLINAGASFSDGLLNPHWFDAVFPIFAFLMVIVLPSVICSWVIYKTIREKKCSEGES